MDVGIDVYAMYDLIRVCCRVEQSADSMGAAQIEIQAKKFFHGFLEKSFKILSCQKLSKYSLLIEYFKFCPLKKISKGGQNWSISQLYPYFKSSKLGCIFDFRKDSINFY